MKKQFLIITILLLGVLSVCSQNIVRQDSTANKDNKTIFSRLQLGGYGEAIMSRFFYSDNYKRYSNATLYKDDNGYGQVDIPHVVFYISYDFGKGWKMSSEVEFEHGGTESAVEIEMEETGEYESEIERGGEVAIEQFWLEKSFSKAANLRMGHIIVPVGITNSYHFPTEFFTTFRPESESSILPCTWHETGISFWGKTDGWHYEVQFIAGLDADRFGSQNWIKGGAGSPYEFKLATAYAGAFRIENYSLIKGLRLGISGYLGNSAANSLKKTNYADVKGTVAIGDFDFEYKSRNFIARGNIIYGHLSDSQRITAINLASRNSSPSPKTPVASDAMSIGVEWGFNIFRLLPCLRHSEHKLFFFKRYEYYDSMFKVAKGVLDNDCWERQQITIGFNYFPIKDIVIKAQWSSRIFNDKYNNENTISVGIAYSGMFIR
ncbi:MAG: hypothetical protein LBR17_01600 [Bacteroidales bacterium]|jgi:hypothetical protein|nr:hypothetical protein [Bacteroidales bacterium]